MAKAVYLTSLFRAFTPVVTVLIAIAVSSTLAFATGNNPLQILISIFLGAYGSYYSIASTLNLTGVLVLTGLSALVAFRCGVWNIGVEGQLYMGAIGATLIALSQVGLSCLHLALTLIVAAGFGCFWGFIPGILKSKLHVDEVVSTILMNYGAILMIDYLVSRPLRDPTITWNASPSILGSARLPYIPGTEVNWGIVLVVVAAVLVYIVMDKTALGFEIGLVGGNPVAARYAGVRVSRTILLSMMISGGIAGLAGGLVVTGESLRLMLGISREYGYIGIGVAMLAGLGSLATIPSAFFYSTLVTGGIAMQREIGIPYSYVRAFMAVVILIITARHILADKMSRIWATRL